MSDKDSVAHPSYRFSGKLLADYASRRYVARHGRPPTLINKILAMIKFRRMRWASLHYDTVIVGDDTVLMLAAAYQSLCEGRSVLLQYFDNLPLFDELEGLKNHARKNVLGAGAKTLIKLKTGIDEQENIQEALTSGICQRCQEDELLCHILDHGGLCKDALTPDNFFTHNSQRYSAPELFGSIARISVFDSIEKSHCVTLFSFNRVLICSQHYPKCFNELKEVLYIGDGRTPSQYQLVSEAQRLQDFALAFNATQALAQEKEHAA